MKEKRRNKQQKAANPANILFLNSMPLFRTIKLNLLFLVFAIFRFTLSAERRYPNKKVSIEAIPIRNPYKQHNVGLEIFICGDIAGSTDC